MDGVYGEVVGRLAVEGMLGVALGSVACCGLSVALEGAGYGWFCISTTSIDSVPTALCFASYR